MLPLFLYLNALDFLTTLVGLKFGYREASPFVAMLVRSTGPVLGLVVSKVVAAGLVGLSYLLNRPRVIGMVNYFYGGLIVWNLGAMLFT